MKRIMTKALAIFMVVAIMTGMGATISLPDLLDGRGFIQFGDKAFAAVDDQYTKLQMHFDGQNGQTSFTDECGKTVLANGDAQISSAQSKFGGASGYFDGNGDYVSVQNSSDFDFGNGDFTIDWWEYAASYASVTLIGKRLQGNQVGPFVIYDSKAYLSSNGSTWDIGILDLGTIPTSQWVHIALIRSGTQLAAYVNGVQKSTVTSSASLYVNTSPVLIGSNGDSSYFNGYIDELRISKGIARWTSNFTPPTLPYSKTSQVYEYKYTGAMQQFTVPSGVNRIKIDCFGAQGGDSVWGSSYPNVTAPGGLGGCTSGIVNVSPGDVLNIFVGGKGGTGSSSSIGTGGYNGGGNTGKDQIYWGGYAGAGGGASDVRKGGINLNNRIIVAGGGGGSVQGGGFNGGYSAGGAGGATDSTGIGGTMYSAYGGKPGTQTSGGIAGDKGSTYQANFTLGQDGTLGQGGNAGTGNWYSNGDGGGGGGGYYGGGGGSALSSYNSSLGYYSGSSAGGGGSGFLSSDFTDTYTKSGVRTGNGLVSITLLNAAPSITIASPNSNQSYVESDMICPSINISDIDGEELTCRYFIDSETSPRETRTVSNTMSPQNISFYSLHPDSFSEGKHVLRFEATDGNSTTQVMRSIIVDRKPTIGDISTTSTENSITVTGSATDSASGLATNPYSVSVGINNSGALSDNIAVSTTNYDYTLSSQPSFVTNTANDISGNSGRKVTVLSNGWIIVPVYDNTSKFRFMVSKDKGETWSQLAYGSFTLQTGGKYAVASKGTIVHFIASGDSDTDIYYLKFDAGTVTNTDLNPNFKMIESGQTSIGTGVSLSIDQNSGKLFGAWCSKNSTYQNSFNIRTAESTDGGATWSTPLQVTIENTIGYDYTSPNIIARNGNPLLVYRRSAAGWYFIQGCSWSGSQWQPFSGTSGNIYGGVTYDQSNPGAVVSPNGDIHVVWRGVDASDNTVNNIRYSKSTDGGATWSPMEKLTSTNIYDQGAPTISVDKNNNLYVQWAGTNSASPTNSQLRQVIFNGTWGAVTNLTSAANSQSAPSAADTNDFTSSLVIWQDAQASAIRFAGKMNSWVESLSPSTVAGSAYDLSGNGGRKITVLSNGWIVAALINNNTVIFKVSKDNGNTFSDLCYYTKSSGLSIALTSFGTNVYCLASSGAAVKMVKFDATLVSNTDLFPAKELMLDSQSVVGQGCSIECDQSTGYLYAAWNSKNSSYPNSYNVRYSKSIDGGVTWGNAEQVTTNNYSGIDNTNPCIVIKKGKPIILLQCVSNALYYYIDSWYQKDNIWTWSHVYSCTSYNQQYPSAVVSQDGAVHVVWQGLDSTDSSQPNIRYSKSSDDGVTWSTAIKLTNGNVYSQIVPSIASDKNNSVYVLWPGKYQGSPTCLQLREIVQNNNTWSSIQTLTNGTLDQGVISTCSSLSDFTDPLCIWQDNQSSSIKFRGTWGTTPLRVTYTTPNNLTPNTSYKVTFQAKDIGGNIATYTKEVYTKAAAPTITATSVSATSMDLSVTDTNPSNTQYQITTGTKFVTQSGSLTSVPTWITLLNKKVKVTGITAGTNYTFQIVARNGEGIETTSVGTPNTTTPIPPLDAPEGAKATALSESKIRITWKPVQGATGYTLEADGVQKDAGTNLFYDDTNLQAGSTHKYRVCAKAGISPGTWSTYITAKTKIPPPAPPISVTSTAHGTSIEIAWAAATGATGYDIELDGGIISLGKVTTYTWTGLKSLSMHTFRVRSKNIIGAGDWSSLQTVMTTDGLPATVTNIQVSVSNTNATFKWPQTLDAESYEIVEVVDGQDVELADNWTGTSFEEKNLKPLSQHTYKIRGENSIGVSAEWSQPVNISTYLLDTPQNIRMDSSADAIKLTWDPVQTASSYEIYDETGQVHGTSQTNTYSDSGLTPETKHIYRIKAKNTQGESGFSDELTVFTLPVKPAVPDNVDATVGQDTIIITWDPVANAEGYDVELDGILMEDDNTPKYVHSELSPYTLHTYRVRARNSAIEGDWSSLQSIRTLPTLPTAPKEIGVKSSSSGTLISWSPVESAKSYDIEVFDGKTTTVIENVLGTSYIHRRVTQFVECRYRIRTKNVEGISDWSGYIVNNAIKAECKKNNNVDLGLTATDVVDFTPYTMVVTYNAAAMEVTDLCSMTGNSETTAGKIEGTDIEIIDFTPGKITFKVSKAVNPGESWTGVINSIKFKAKATGGTTITYTVLCKPE